MHKLIDYVCDELEQLERKAEKGSLSMSEVQYADTLAHLKKNILTADAMMDEGESGMYPYYGSYARGGSYNRGGSYARRRDSMGRYSRDDDMMSDLRELMQKAPDEKTRQEFQRFMDKLERM